MALLDLKTDLKTLKYSGDQPGGGWSGKPYIRTNIPSDLARIPVGVGIVNLDNRGLLSGIDPIYRIQSTGNLDYPIRGGDLQFNIGTQTFTLSSQIDKTRIRKFFEDKPRGTAFLQKQIGLNLTNPKIETGNSFQVAPNSNLIPGLLENTRIYNNGVNTLTQVGVQGTGIHLPRHGIFPLDYASKYYKDVVGAQNVNNDASTNRLLILQNLKLNTRSASTSANPNIVNRLGISYNRNILFQYLGGPGSTYGIGTTVIKRTEDTSRAATKFNSVLGMTYDQIMSQNLNVYDDGQRSKSIQDFKSFSKIQSREEYYGLTIKQGDSDRMNKLSSFMFNNSIAPWETTDPAAKGATKDIIKFVFEAIENNNPQQSWALFFRAMINGFQDNNQASINSFKYLGRGEDFYTYQGVSRTITFGFKIAVTSEQELKPLYTKLNHLISQTYPDYSENFGIMRAPVVRLTVGDYLYRVAGMLESVNVNVDDNYSWEINKLNLDSLKQLPHIINVQCTFKPIQDFLPRRANKYNRNVPYITEQDEEYTSIADGFRLLNLATIDQTGPTLTARNRNVVVNTSLQPISQTQNVNSNRKQEPPKKATLFETEIERTIRTGDLFAFRQFQVNRGTINNSPTLNEGIRRSLGG